MFTVLARALIGIVPSVVMAQPGAVDAWTGRYQVGVGRTTEEGRFTQQLSLVRAPDADPSRLAERYKIDLGRWNLLDENGKKVASMRRFLPAEYKQFGWATLRASGAIECLDANHIFLCRVEPGTMVSFGQDGSPQERLLARTGFFGIRLHWPVFELTRLSASP